MLGKRGAVLVNETLNMPTFLRRGAGPRGRPPLALPAPADINALAKPKTGHAAIDLFEDMDTGSKNLPEAVNIKTSGGQGADDQHFFLTEHIGNVADANQDLDVDGDHDG